MGRPIYLTPGSSALHDIVVCLAGFPPGTASGNVTEPFRIIIGIDAVFTALLFQEQEVPLIKYVVQLLIAVVGIRCCHKHQLLADLFGPHNFVQRIHPIPLLDIG